MTLGRLIVREIGHRKLNFLFAVLAVAGTRPVSAQAKSRSVCRHMKAGICRMSATSATRPAPFVITTNWMITRIRATARTKKITIAAPPSPINGDGPNKSDSKPVRWPK